MHTVKSREFDDGYLGFRDDRDFVGDAASLDDIRERAKRRHLFAIRQTLGHDYEVDITIARHVSLLQESLRGLTRQEGTTSSQSFRKARLQHPGTTP